MIRRTLKSVLRRVVDRTPHIPSARGSGRERPSQGMAPPPPPPSAAADEDDEDDGSEVELEPEELERWRQEGRPLHVLDIREPHELWSGTLDGALLIPMNSVPRYVEALPRDGELVVVCAAGMRSFGVAHWLREQGFSQAWSLNDGVAGGHDAGFPLYQPPTKGDLRLMQAVRLEDGRTGTIQRLDEDGARVRVLLDGADLGEMVEVDSDQLTRGR